MVLAIHISWLYLYLSCRKDGQSVEDCESQAFCQLISSYSGSIIQYTALQWYSHATMTPPLSLLQGKVCMFYHLYPTPQPSSPGRLLLGLWCCVWLSKPQGPALPLFHPPARPIGPKAGPLPQHPWGTMETCAGGLHDLLFLSSTTVLCGECPEQCILKTGPCLLQPLYQGEHVDLAVNLKWDPESQKFVYKNPRLNEIHQASEQWVSASHFSEARETSVT